MSRCQLLLRSLVLVTTYANVCSLKKINLQADRSGTIVEVLAEDGKPVSVDTVSSSNDYS